MSLPRSELPLIHQVIAQLHDTDLTVLQLGNRIKFIGVCLDPACMQQFAAESACVLMACFACVQRAAARQ